MPNQQLADAMVVDCGAHSMRYGAAGGGGEPGRMPTATEPHPSDGEAGEEPPAKAARTERGAGPCAEGWLDPTRDDAVELLYGAFRRQGKGWDSGKHPLLVASATCAPRRATEMLAQVCFETLGVPALYLLPAPLAALFHQGRHSGIVVDAGESACGVAAVDASVVLRAAAQREAGVGAREVTRLFVPLLRDAAGAAGAPVPRSAEWAAAGALKEAAMECAARHADARQGKARANWGTAQEAAKQCALSLPDGKELSLAVGKERLLPAELLFAPHLPPYEVECRGVPKLLGAALEALPAATAKLLAKHCCVVGGGSMAAGFVERLRAEAESSAALQPRPALAHSRARADAAWHGARAAAQLPQYGDVWLRRADYDDVGPCAIWSVQQP